MNWKEAKVGNGGEHEYCYQGFYVKWKFPLRESKSGLWCQTHSRATSNTTVRTVVLGQNDQSTRAASTYGQSDL